MDNLANRHSGPTVLLVITLALSSLTVLHMPEMAAAQSPSAGQDVLLDPTKPIVYWAGAEGNDLKFINSSTGAIIDSIVVGAGPSSICLSSDGTTLYVAIPSYKCVVVVDAESHSVTGNISLSFYPLSVRLDGKGFVYVSGSIDNSGWIYSIDIGTLQIKKSVSPGSGNLAIEISPDGATLLAMQISSPVKVYKYGINAGVFNYVGADNDDLGSNLQQEAVDWARGKIYLASGWPYGIEVVSINTLDRLGMYPMEAYPTCVAMSSDGRFLYGAQSHYQNALWMFNATDGSLMGTMSMLAPIEHLTVAHDLKSAYVGPPIQRIPLSPVIEQIYPAPGSLLGYTPTHFTMRLSAGLPHNEGQNVTIHADETALNTYPFGMHGDWIYYRGDRTQVLSDGIHNFSISLRWLETIVWENASFVIDRESSIALSAALLPNSPENGSIQLVEPLNISASIVYTMYDMFVEDGWIMLDGENLSTAFVPERLTASYNALPNPGWHNVSAFISWDGGLGKKWTNWSFLVMQGPLMTPIYPARDQTLMEVPNRIEVAVDFRDTGGDVSAPQLYVDGTPVMTTIAQNGTMKASISWTLRTGNHSARATLDWAGGKISISWWFWVDVFVGPGGEELVRYEYKDEFSVLVPTGGSWSLEEDSDISGEVFPLVMYGPLYGNFRTNIIISSVHDRAVEETQTYLEEQLSQALEELEQSGITPDIIVSPQIRTVDNHTAYVALIQLEGYSVYQEIAIIASEPHERYWVLILSINIGLYYSYDDMFDRMIDGFRIETEPASAWSDLGQAAIGLGFAAIAGAVSGAVVWLTRKRRGPVGPAKP